MARVLIETYGCTLNQADSEIMGNLLEQSGHAVDYGEYSPEKRYDCVIVNTCTVKKPTEQRILNRLTRMRNLANRLIVAGCMTSANADIVARAVPEASMITTSNVAMVSEAVTKIASGERALYDRYAVTDKISLYRASSSLIARIAVSEGCLSRCSFCETRFARGPLNSFSEKLILKAIENSVAKGAKEIELTSQDIGAYGLDKKTNIAELVSKAAQTPGDFRIRIGMLNPEHLRRQFDSLIEAYKSEKVYRFIHLPVQSGSNRVLGSMNRNYTTEEFESQVNELRSKINGINIETDIIVGYPTETDEDFAESIDLIKRVRPMVTNVSKFGARPHAAASKLKQLANDEIKRRSVEMSRTVREVQRQERRRFVGATIRTLVTEKNCKSFVGRSDGYVSVVVRGGGVRLGEFARARITDNTSACLIGELT